MPKTKKIWSLETAVYSALRRAHRNSPEYRQTLSNAKSEYFIPSKKGKPMRRVHFECAKCRTKGSRKSIYVDHINPVVDPLTGRTTFSEYISRLFCGVLGLQCLCKSCHDSKSKAENAIRRKVKKDKKNETKSSA